MSDIQAFGPPPADHLQQAQALVLKIRRTFAHKHPFVIGWALVDLVAMHLAAYELPPEAQDREPFLKDHMDAVRALVPLYVEVKEERQRAGRPKQ
jgi:hypothetical protein